MFIILCRNSLLTKSTSPSFFFMSDKPRLYQLKIITSTRSTVRASESFQPYEEILLRKGTCPVLRTNKKPHQLIKHAKFSYSIVSLVFRKFSWGAYCNGLNRGTWKLSHSKYFKKYKPCLFSTSWRESALLHIFAQGAVLQKFIYTSKITGHHFTGWV